MIDTEQKRNEYFDKLRSLDDIYQPELYLHYVMPIRSNEDAILSHSDMPVMDAATVLANLADALTRDSSVNAASLLVIALKLIYNATKSERRECNEENEPKKA